jgi:hypothetical protein
MQNRQGLLCRPSPSPTNSPNPCCEQHERERLCVSTMVGKAETERPGVMLWSAARTAATVLLVASWLFCCACTFVCLGVGLA